MRSVAAAAAAHVIAPFPPPTLVAHVSWYTPTTTRRKKGAGTSGHGEESGRRERHASPEDTSSVERAAGGYLPTQRARHRQHLRRASFLEALREPSTAPPPLATTSAALTPTAAASNAPTFLSASHFARAPLRQGITAGDATSALHSRVTNATMIPPHPSSSSFAVTSNEQLRRQQDLLRDAFTHARQHHNVRLRKDPRVYRAECRAFRQSHQGRSPTSQEVSRIVAVPLAPVAALKLLAHTDPHRSPLHATTEAAVVLHNTVTQNELVKSDAPQLVRCLRCFHVYTARPRTLWGDEVQQSGIQYEKALQAQRRQRPVPGRRATSVGRRRERQEADPTCCPKCSSPRAQWMMEYVHVHNHERS